MLTDTRIRNAKPGAVPVKLTDAKGLYLEVRSTGAKLWRYRYRIAGKENVFAIGEYPSIGLSDARAAREEARKLVKQGIQPAHARKLDTIRQCNEANSTFEKVVREWIATRHWAENTKANRMSQIEMHLLPALGKLPIRQITSAHVLDVLKRAEKKEVDTRTRKRGADTRSVGGGTVVVRLRQIISGTFDHAISTLRMETNPATPVRGAFKVHRETHKTPLTRPQVGTLLRALDDYSGHFQTAVALQLLWLTLARPSEMTRARWAEFDFDAATWTIPAERMKMREEHVIPLPKQAVTFLTRMHALSGHRDIVFSHRDRRDESMTYGALNKGVERLKLAFKFTPHAARTTASTMFNEMGFRSEVIEKQLAHEERNSSRRPYNRPTYLEERRAMMQQWADMLDELRQGVGKVVPIRAGEVAGHESHA